MEKPRGVSPDTRERARYAAVGLASGLLNGFFGSGGGLAAVPMLKMTGIEPKKSHATSVAVMFFLSLVSAAGYAVGGAVDVKLLLPLLPAGAAGAFFGSLWLRNIKAESLRRIFAALLIFSGGRMMLG